MFVRPHSGDCWSSPNQLLIIKAYTQQAKICWPIAIVFSWRSAIRCDRYNQALSFILFYFFLFLFPSSGLGNQYRFNSTDIVHMFSVCVVNDNNNLLMLKLPCYVNYKIRCEREDCGFWEAREMMCDMTGGRGWWSMAPERKRDGERERERDGQRNTSLGMSFLCVVIVFIFAYEIAVRLIMGSIPPPDTDGPGACDLWLLDYCYRSDTLLANVPAKIHHSKLINRKKMLQIRSTVYPHPYTKIA